MISLIKISYKMRIVLYECTLLWKQPWHVFWVPGSVHDSLCRAWWVVTVTTWRFSQWLIKEFAYIKYSFSLFYNAPGEHDRLLSSFYWPQTNKQLPNFHPTWTLERGSLRNTAIRSYPLPPHDTTSVFRATCSWLTSCTCVTDHPGCACPTRLCFVQILSTVISVTVSWCHTRNALQTGGEYFYPNSHTSLI